MIQSAEEFYRLRTSKNQQEYDRAAAEGLQYKGRGNIRRGGKPSPMEKSRRGKPQSLTVINKERMNE
jgi:hypothetical protein